MNELVSIIIPTYQSEKYISATIQSVQNQIHTNWEIILVDDASTDTTMAIVKAMAKDDSRIKYIELHQNSGTGIARNTALNQAQGRYIAFLDADDLWKPEKLSIQLAFLNKHKVPFTFSAYDCIDEDGNPMNKRVVPPQKLTYRQLFFCNYIGNLTGIYDTHFFGKIPISSSRKRQDWMHWLTLLKKIKKANAVPESLAYYRVRTHSLSASKFDLIQHNFAVYKDHHGYNWPVALACMAVFLITQLAIKPFYIKRLSKPI
ncbi:glycosyltransferase family 2 protein [Flavobacterium sp. UMI-01]|uniref:glycosyltransferase family 2 protein n=1 Tax=Flavobacterium sp. UMI-01 TaxID=1441053 RepID=UPI001C7D8955|nr:glycosyltransferase family 2 protein [Flavobacterium sp. UMI-01]GIZ08087.1 glycosyl transferase [Flavobacterium sp. UMI-01]